MLSDLREAQADNPHDELRCHELPEGELAPHDQPPAQAEQRDHGHRLQPDAAHELPQDPAVVTASCREIAARQSVAADGGEQRRVAPLEQDGVARHRLQPGSDAILRPGLADGGGDGSEAERDHGEQSQHERSVERQQDGVIKGEQCQTDEGLEGEAEPVKQEPAG